MSRRRSSAAEDFIDVVSRLPWWLCLLVGLAGYAFFGWLASRPLGGPGVAGSGHLPGVVMRTFATFGQYLVPLLCGAAAVLSAVRSRRRGALLQDAKSVPARSAIDGMSWADFERLVGAIFRERGYRVIETGGGGADGGVDLVLGKGGEKFLVQCKQWRALKVGVSVVRELYGVMAARGAAGGFVVTSGTFTDDARAFAEGRNVTTLDGEALARYLASPSGRREHAPAPTEAAPRRRDEGQSAARAPVAQTPPEVPAVPTCPSCGAPMARRVAKRGASAGAAFWGCSTYPRCRGTRPAQ